MSLFIPNAAEVNIVAMYAVTDLDTNGILTCFIIDETDAGDSLTNIVNKQSNVVVRLVILE
jgi:hypothetical protein